MRSCSRRFMLVCLVGLIFAAAFAAAEIPEGPCDCYVGTKVSENPCQCTCPGEWLPPRCNFKAGWSVELKLYVTSDSFASENFVRSFNNNLEGVDGVSFRRKTGNNVPFNGQTLSDVRIVSAGRHVAAILSAVTAQPAWVQSLGIVAADLAEKEQAPAFGAGQIVIYENAAPAFQVTLESLGYVLGAILIVVLLPTIELCCCMSYSAKDIEELEQEEADARAYEKYQADRAAEAAAAAEASATAEGVVVGSPVAGTADDDSHHPVKPTPGQDDDGRTASPPPPAAAAGTANPTPPHSPSEGVALTEEQQQSEVFQPRPDSPQAHTMRPRDNASPPGQVEDSSDVTAA
uniref:Uncharacterized protein n=1 Tax=Neobodo designis TaxID=312471 RepID=A0A7S1M464_NEODS|mmetsp:Transcript_34009/g.104983  ORF Transcript_34009/g.104983 Transcript_34009/m.104983 type:complete len:347 (+) Transcript_34009:108-1148(+)